MRTEDERVGTAPPPLQPAAPRVDAVAIGAAVCIVLGWFVLSTLETEMGGIRLSFHFYDMWTVLAHPSRLLTGVADGDRLRGVLFGAVCLAVLAGAVLPQASAGGRLRVPYLAPLILMLVCGALLYEKTSGELIAQTGPPDALGAHLIAFANTVAHRLSAAATRHISLGLGAYLAFGASIVLAVRGVPRRHRL
ncbi:MAG TPA: hypothetical protein VN730_04795 [Steroidobacteraceae bacterium]|nr:hypothetical protein [Steroidobacteraceae bacterium]